MAKLPEVSVQRPVARPTRAIATVSPSAAGATGRALQGFGQDVQRAGFYIQEREDTAAVKERDAYVSDQIRALLYDPETGFANQRGKNAVASRADILAKLERLTDQATTGLSPSAKRKFEDTLRRRVDGALNTVDRHTSGERTRWLDEASAARIESARQDALAGGLEDFQSNFGVIESELRQKAQREGWSTERVDLELRSKKSELLANHTLEMANRDASFAMAFLEKNKGDFLPDDFTKLTRALKPEVAKQEGQNAGNAAFARLGNMSGLIEIADDTLGMNENEQREALQQYMADGGVNLDPSKVAWCAAFINATLGKAGIKGTNSNLARSFLKWGQEVTEPKEGDVVVLSRGSDPTKGHVGFFKGFDENGNILLLGGNQGDAVSVKAYNRRRLLGYRRAASAPDSMDAASELQRLAQIQDPERRDAAIKQFNLQYSAATGVVKARREKAEGLAFQFIEEGSDPDELPLDVRQSLGMKTMSSLRTYHSKILSGERVETDPAAYLELRQMQADSPEDFNAVNILSYADRLSASDLKGFMDDQTKPSSDVTRVAASTMMTVASRRLRDAGFEKQDEAPIQTRLLRWQDDFIKENNRAPTQTEIDERVGHELVPVLVDGFGIDRERPLADVSFSEMEASDLIGQDVSVDGVRVPEGVVQEAIDILSRDGSAITADDVLALVRDLYVEQGLIE